MQHVSLPKYSTICWFYSCKVSWSYISTSLRGNLHVFGNYWLICLWSRAQSNKECSAAGFEMLRGITCLLQEKSPFSDDARKQTKRARSRFGGNAVIISPWNSLQLNWSRLFQQVKVWICRSLFLFDAPCEICNVCIDYYFTISASKKVACFPWQAWSERDT